MSKSEMERSLDRPLRGVLEHMQTRIMTKTSWFGVQAFKNPLDFWIYQELIFESKPDVVDEIGNHTGGGALALAHLCDFIGHGEVIGIDVNHTFVPQKVKEHPRISLVTGDACESHDLVMEMIGKRENVLVIEDSAHTYDNTLRVLRAYAHLIRPGNYFIVEDSICHHGLNVGPSPGPYEAIEKFLAEDDTFEIDAERESFLITWNPKGYLKKRTDRILGG